MELLIILINALVSKLYWLKKLAYVVDVCAIFALERQMLC